MIGRFLETFYIQEMTAQPSPFPPPWNDPIWVMGDGREVKGKFLQSQTDEVLIASAMGTRTHGRFITSIDTPIDKRTILKRARDDFFFALEGDPIEAPEQAIVKLKVFECRIKDRGQT